MTETELSAREELYELADLLHKADREEKTAKTRKESYRGPFFDLISEVVREEIPLARQTIEVEVDADFDIDLWKAQNYPEWRICGIDQKEAGVMLITLEEHEDFKKFEFTHNGYKYGRQIRMEGAGLDVEGFYNHITNPDGVCDQTYEAVCKLLDCVTPQVVTTYEVDEAQLAKVMTEYPETVTLIQEYMRPGTPKPALLPIRPAKEEDE